MFDAEGEDGTETRLLLYRAAWPVPGAHAFTRGRVDRFGEGETASIHRRVACRLVAK